MKKTKNGNDHQMSTHQGSRTRERTSNCRTYTPCQRYPKKGKAGADPSTVEIRTHCLNTARKKASPTIKLRTSIHVTSTSFYIRRRLFMFKEPNAGTSVRFKSLYLVSRHPKEGNPDNQSKRILNTCYNNFSPSEAGLWTNSGEENQKRE